MEEEDGLGRSPLHAAAAGGMRLVVEAILGAAQPDQRRIIISASDSLGATPLHLARGREVADLLLKARADPAAADRRGATPLHTTSDPEVAALLLQPRPAAAAAAAGAASKPAAAAVVVVAADVNARDRAGLTPLMAHAANPMHTNMVTWLVQRAAAARAGGAAADPAAAGGADVDLAAADGAGRTALHHAAASGNADHVRILLQAKGDVHARDHFDSTPLHTAAHRAHEKMVGVLLEGGANPLSRDRTGRTPLQSATGAAVRVLEQAVRAKAGPGPTSPSRRQRDVRTNLSGQLAVS